MTPLSHSLSVGDTVVWASQTGEPDPYAARGDKPLIVEQVYPRELAAWKGLSKGEAVEVELVAVAYGVSPDVPHHEVPPGETHDTCKDDPLSCKHFTGMNGGGAEFRGRELAKNLRKVT